MDPHPHPHLHHPHPHPPPPDVAAAAAATAGPIDLENTFSHPDGLYTARCLVGALVKSAVESAQRSAKENQHGSAEEEEGDSTRLSPSIPLHLQEPGALESLLAFKGVSMFWSYTNGGSAAEENALTTTTMMERNSHDIPSHRPLLPNIHSISYGAGYSGPSASAHPHRTPVHLSTTARSLQTQHPEDSLTTAAHTLSSLSNTRPSSNFRTTPFDSRTQHQPPPQSQPQPQSLSFPSIIPSIEGQSCTATRLAPNCHAPDVNPRSIISSTVSTPSAMEANNDSSKKRKAAEDDTTAVKKQKVDSLGKAKRVSKPKPEKQTMGSEIPDALWMQILEYAPPRFLGKMRLVSKRFKCLVDEFDSIYVNCRLSNFGSDMPAPPDGISERQYNNLLQGKGCQNAGCKDKLTTRTHWSWYKRWCMTCWKEKIVRDDRLQKLHAHTYVRPTLTMILECIPVGMQDSFVKPHDFVVEDGSPRQRGAPRLYKVYLREDVTKILEEYEALTPPPYQEDPTHTPEQKAAAQAAHQELMDGLPDKRSEFIAERKAKNEEHMAKVIKIEQGIKSRREVIREPNSENRNARKRLFSRRAAEDLPHIPEDFVKTCEPFKAATRVFRDPGSERGWQLLKPKIEKAFQADPNARGRQNQIKATANGESDRESSFNSAASPRWGFDGGDERPDHSSHSQMMSNQYHNSQPHGRPAPTNVTSQMLIHPQIHGSAQNSFMRRSNSANNAPGPSNLLPNGIAFPYAHYMTSSLERSFSGESGYGVHRSPGINGSMGTGGFQVTGANTTINRPSHSTENSGSSAGIVPSGGSAPNRMMASSGGSGSNGGIVTSGGGSAPTRMTGTSGGSRSSDGMVTNGSSGPSRMMSTNVNSGSRDNIATNGSSGPSRMISANLNAGSRDSMATNSSSGPSRMISANLNAGSRDSTATNSSSGPSRMISANLNAGSRDSTATNSSSGPSRMISANLNAGSRDSMVTSGNPGPDRYSANNTGSANDRFSVSEPNTTSGHFAFTNTMSIMTDTHMLNGRQSMAGSHSFMGENSMTGSYNTNFTNSSNHTDRLSIQHLISQPSPNPQSTNTYEDFSRAFR